MSADRELTRVVRSWLDEGATTLPDRVLDAVLDQLPMTPQRRHFWQAWRTPLVSTTRFALAGVTVLAIAAIGLALVLLTAQHHGPRRDHFSATGRPGHSQRPGDDEHSTDAEHPATPPADAMEFPASGALDERSYVTGVHFPVRLSATFGPGNWVMWTNGSEAVAAYRGSPDPPAGHGIGFVVVDLLYNDPCNKAAGTYDPGPSAEDFVSAIRQQALTTSTEPVDVTIGGYSGQYVELTRDGMQAGCTGYVALAVDQGAARCPAQRARSTLGAGYRWRPIDHRCVLVRRNDRR